MAKGDLRSSRQRSGGWGSSRSYNDGGRGVSKTAYEEFERHFSAIQDVQRAAAWLLNDNDEHSLSVSVYDERLYYYVHNMVERYSLHDWAWRKFEDTPSNDGRVRRLVIAKCGQEVWQQFQLRARTVWDARKEADAKHRAEQAESEAQERAAFAAKLIQRQTEEKQLLMTNVRLIAGSISSEFESSFSHHTVYNELEGDLDDVVDGYTSGYGFADEVRQAHGIKLQITVSLDVSNSMYYNRLYQAASDTFRDIYLAMEVMKEDYPDDLYIAAFTFSDDGYEANERGRRAKCISHHYSWYSGRLGDPIEQTDSSLGAVEPYRSAAKYSFSGEDTWFYPLFERIEEWEKQFSHPGAYRLDLIITDAVIEHPSDIRRSDVIQERRDGSLQTVMLNLMPEKEWVNSDLPLRCVQYAAHPDNIGGLLRNVITEFVGAHV